MWSAPGSIARIVVRMHACTGERVGDANRELTTLVRQAVRAGVGAEVLVEAPVLLHDHDHVLDLVNPDAWLDRRGGRRRHRQLGAATGDSDDEDCDCKRATAHAANLAQGLPTPVF